jgi:DNA-binding ferritin-like protein
MENISEVVAGLQELFNQVKYFHWQTKSYAQHQALGGVFDDLEDLIDEFVEVAMGKYGRPSTKNQELEMFDLEDVDIMEWTSGVVDYLISFDDILDETEDSDLLNIRDEMMATFNKLKYLLTLKENKRMNKKVIKLTESDLTRIIERVINEKSEIMGAYYTGSLLSTDGKYVKSIINNLKKDDNLKTERFEIVDIKGDVIRKSNDQKATKKMFIEIDENFKFKLNSYIVVALYKKRTNPKNPTDFPSVQLYFGADENGKLYVEGVGL